MILLLAYLYHIRYIYLYYNWYYSFFCMWHHSCCMLPCSSADPRMSRLCVSCVLADDSSFSAGRTREESRRAQAGHAKRGGQLFSQEDEAKCMLQTTQGNQWYFIWSLKSCFTRFASRKLPKITSCGATARKLTIFEMETSKQNQGGQKIIREEHS